MVKHACVICVYEATVGKERLQKQVQVHSDQVWVGLFYAHEGGTNEVQNEVGMFILILRFIIL